LRRGAPRSADLRRRQPGRRDDDERLCSRRWQRPLFRPAVIDNATTDPIFVIGVEDERAPAGTVVAT
jgi:hypothetical protein